MSIVQCHNLLIDEVKKYTPKQIKLFYNMLYQYRMTNMIQKLDVNQIEVNREDVKRIIEGEHLGTKDIIDMVASMPDRFKIIDVERNEIGYLHVIQLFAYNLETDKFKIVFNEHIDDILLTEKYYGKINLEDISRLKGANAIRLYELACRYRQQGNYKMKIEMFRLFFKVSSKYRMSDIDKYILARAIEEINEKTHLNIKVEKVKRHNKVTHLHFFIESDGKEWGDY